MTVNNESSTRVIPLGGVGEFGANATIIQSGETTILIDFGIMFPPDQRQPGVEFYINDPERIKSQFPDLSAIFVTHAHEDHIGGIPFLLGHVDVPIYTMPYTAQCIRNACSHFKNLDAKIHTVTLNQPIRHGDLAVEFIGVTHSIAQACALAISTIDGTILHSGDFKVDPLPGDAYPFQSERLAELGNSGVVALLIMDSTNAHKPGFSPGEEQINPVLFEKINEAEGRIFFTTFSSHMPRLKNLELIARKTNRKIALVGRGFRKHFQTSTDTGYIKPSDVFVNEKTLNKLEDNRVIVVVTGSQGEQQSALVRIGKGEINGLAFKSGDTIIFSSKAIPGNERQIALLASDFERRGLTVITERQAQVHTSGHAYRDDLAYLLSLTRPRAVAPIHGEFHHLLSHHGWLKTLVSEDQTVHLIQDGDIISIDDRESWISGQIETGMIPVDGNQDLPISSQTLKERKDMMYSGMLLLNVSTDEDQPEPFIEAECHGMVQARENIIPERVISALQGLDLDLMQTDEERCDQIFRQTRRSLKKLMYGRPLIKIVLNGRIVR